MNATIAHIALIATTILGNNGRIWPCQQVDQLEVSLEDKAKCNSWIGYQPVNHCALTSTGKMFKCLLMALFYDYRRKTCKVFASRFAHARIIGRGSDGTGVSANC